MVSSLRARTLAWLAPEHGLRCHRRRWTSIVAELARRSDAVRESGAFLLGRRWGVRREVLDVVYYDDLAPDALAHGDIVFPRHAYGPLWRICSARNLAVVADVHTHPGRAWQSRLDRDHPMIVERGHLALILPRYAQAPCGDTEIGLYEYLGGKQWRDHSGTTVSRFFLRTFL